jgi:hypothetical protein
VDSVIFTRRTLGRDSPHCCPISRDLADLQLWHIRWLVPVNSPQATRVHVYRTCHTSCVTDILLLQSSKPVSVLSRIAAATVRLIQAQRADSISQLTPPPRAHRVLSTLRHGLCIAVTL